MNSDIRRYLSLRDSLVQEKAKLEDRLREINEALGATAPASSAARSSTTPSAPATRGRKGGRRRGAGGISLRDAVLQVTSKGPLTKEEILQGVKQLGYRFSTNNPLNSLGVILYGKNPKFKNENGRFSSTSTESSGRGSSEGSNGGGAGRKRRKLSPEARERIAAAQRARWAKTKGNK